MEKDKIIIPTASLIHQGGKYSVFTYKDGAAHLKEIIIGSRDDSNVEVKSGLSELDELIVVGQHKLMDNTVVEKVRE
ncbi:MAG: hypothetical protein HZB76_03770 [Chlamydiae bacterium]|nr:hypothetical protein [Chlamydiota bacterium]